MAKGWVKAISEDEGLSSRINLCGFVDVDLGAADALALAAGGGNVVTGIDLHRVLQQTGAELLFDIVAPPARFGVVETGLLHGCHVLSEKPMATSLTEAGRLIDLAQEAGRIHAIVQNRRYITGVRRLKSFIESGAIGDLTGLHCDFFIGAHFGGFREDMDHVLLLDMAIHTFDAARFMSGKIPKSVYCTETNPKGSWYRDGASAFAIFDFSDEVKFTYRGSWCAEGADTSWESNWRITGTHGSVLWDGFDGFKAHRVAGGEGFLRDQEELPVPENENVYETRGHASVLDAFLRAIETGTLPETRAEDNIHSLAMVFAAIESAESGRRVDIQEE
jgi:predicted dehydrogenase